MTSIDVNSGVLTEVVVPSEPSTVASINVHHHVGQVELLQGVCYTLLVAISGILAGGEVDVGDQVGERIWLNDESNSGVRVVRDNGGDC